MEKPSRRDFLKTAAVGLLSFALPPEFYELKYESQENKFMPSFKFIGPPIIQENKTGSEGERTIWADSENSDRMLAFTWKNGIWKTSDGGKKWEKIEIPASERKGNDKPVARDVVSIPGTKNILVVFDFSLAVGSFENNEWKVINLPDGSWETQTAHVLPDGRVIVGGRGFPSAGVAISTNKTTNETMSFNKRASRPVENFEWQQVSGLLPNAKDSGFYVRTITSVKEKIYFGGWYGKSNDGTTPGTGLVCIDDKNFKIIPEYSHTFEDARGPMSINTIKITEYKGNEIIFVGGEGTGVSNNRKFDIKKPFLQILVNNKVLSQDLVNCKELFKTGGESDLITPQRGIVICEETGEVLISSGFKEISRASLEDIISGKPILWERITKAPDGQKDFGALHMVLAKKSGNPMLIVGREIYGDGTLPFQQIGVANMTPNIFF